MKNTNYIFYVLVVVASFFTNCASDETAIPKLVCSQPDFVVNKSVEAIQASAGAIVTKYAYDDIIEAYVVSSDENGNFFKTISLQTLATATKPAMGFSVPVDATNLYVDFRVGNKVYVKLLNQYTDINYGSLRIGSVYVNSYNEGAVGRLTQNEYKKVLNASCTTVTEEALVRSSSIGEIVKDSNLNTLIEVTGVQFTEAAVGRHYFEEANNIGGATNWSLIDKNGNQLIFRTSSYADFSKSLVPSGSGKVRGVLTKFGNDYQLVARSEKDVVMTGTKATPFFIQNFQTVVDKSNLSLPGWTNIAVSGTPVWKGGVYSGNGYAEFVISGTKVNSNIAWLISPKIDMDTYKNEVLTFRAAQHHLDIDSALNSLEVLVSTNFDGLNVTKATWVSLKAILPTQATPWYQFVGSGGIDLSKYSGQINIAFKYTGSGKNTALDGAFQVDDVQLFGD